jgi:hypothetical protein
MNPFQIAERFIQLRKVYDGPSWGDRMNIFNDMIVMPMIMLFMLFVRNYDLMSLASTFAKAFSVWRKFIEYTDLKFKVQKMYLHTMQVGGPFIVTNDSTYMPYVFADAVYRVPVGIANSPAGGRLLA